MKEEQVRQIVADMSNEVAELNVSFEPVANELRQITGLCTCGEHAPRKTRGE